MTKFREHRGGLAESLKTTIEVENLTELAKKFGFDEQRITVKPYGFDARIDWNTHIVVVEDYGVLGFTDGEFSP